jgi:hypothetical protein
MRLTECGKAGDGNSPQIQMDLAGDGPWDSGDSVEFSTREGFTRFQKGSMLLLFRI